MGKSDVVEAVKKALEGFEVEVVEVKGVVSIVVDKSLILDVAEKLKEIGFDHVKSVTVTDYSKDGYFEVVYHVSSYGNLELAKYIVALKTKTSTGELRVPSLSKVWENCTFLEREEYDLTGLTFEGHPRLERLLLPEDWDETPPLRKEYKLKMEGIDVE